MTKHLLILINLGNFGKSCQKNASCPKQESEMNIENTGKSQVQITNSFLSATFKICLLTHRSNIIPFHEYSQVSYINIFG